MGKAITTITFLYFLTDKERYNPLDYFLMGIIDEIRFFLLDVKDPPIIKNYVRNDAKN